METTEEQNASVSLFLRVCTCFRCASLKTVRLQTKLDDKLEYYTSAAFTSDI